MIKKSKPSESRIRTGRASMRMHPHLRAAVSFLAKGDRRTVSQWLEMTVLLRMRYELENEFDDSGQLVKPGQEFVYKRNRDPRFR